MFLYASLPYFMTHFIWITKADTSSCGGCRPFVIGSCFQRRQTVHWRKQLPFPDVQAFLISSEMTTFKSYSIQQSVFIQPLSETRGPVKWCHIIRSMNRADFRWSGLRMRVVLWQKRRHRKWMRKLLLATNDKNKISGHHPMKFRYNIMSNQGLAKADAMTQAFHAPMLLVFCAYFDFWIHALPSIHASEMAGKRFYGHLIFKIFRGKTSRTLLNGLASLRRSRSVFFAPISK